MDTTLIIVFILATVIFFLMTSENVSINQCPYPNGKCYDGNGKYQYKGRGSEKESIQVLLSRIDWLAKNNLNKPIYITSYIISYLLILGVMVVMYATSKYILNAWEYVILLIVAFIITFSITNLIGFHSDRYPSYYIRNNISYIADKLSLKIKDNPGNPSNCTKIPHRTYIQDKLCYK